jgi:hypothetical protein
MDPSTHNGLALELFSYNDYRFGRNKDGMDGSNTKKEATMHQHHPFSSYISSNGGVGGGNSGKVNVCRAMEIASAYYTILEKKLVPSSESPYFFGTDKPSYFDAVLFSHLAEALCDVHLILVLANHTRLVRYFQRMYDTYFGVGYAVLFEQHTRSSDVDWITHNNHANARNAFHQIPETIPSKKDISPENIGMSHAIQLMQQLAVHCHQLDEALKDAAKSRLESGEYNVMMNNHRPIGSTLYKWCMGFWDRNAQTNVDSKDYGKEETTATSQDKNDDMKHKWKEQMERMERDKRSNDESWVMGVIVAVFATVLVSASSRSKK